MRALLTVAMIVSAAAHADESSVVPPTCARPARLEGQFNGASVVVITLKATASDSQTVAMALSRKYGFKLVYVRPAPEKRFVASLLTPSEVAKLRCEPKIDVVSYYSAQVMSR